MLSNQIDFDTVLRIAYMVITTKTIIIGMALVSITAEKFALSYCP